MNLAAVAIACFHLSVFIPAILLSFLPINKLFNPNFLLKIWYGWIICIFLLYLMYSSYKGVAGIFHAITDDSAYGKVCYIVKDSEGFTKNNPMPYVDRKHHKSSIERAVNPYNNFKNGAFCRSYPISFRSLTVYAYNATSDNRGNRRAVESDTISNAVTADIILDSYLCFYINREKISKENKSGWFVHSEECDSNADPNSFINIMK
ncbi:MAG: hypothetical protein RPU60_06815 [Candidatus Sedimenticola sp. (ex Thyasira tokunagai)]